MLEIESTLIICSNEPEAIVRRLSGMTTVAGYALKPQPDLDIQDSYLDNEVGIFQDSEFSLRIRQANATKLITLKGPPIPTGWGASERLEIEDAWSHEALSRIIAELRDHDISLSLPTSFDMESPLDTMNSIGLKVVQARKNSRRVRQVTKTSSHDDAPIAELVIDSVAYNFGGTYIGHHEVEVEAKSDNGPMALQDISDTLLSDFGAALRRWEYGKTVTGRAIEEMLRADMLRDMIGSQGNLKPEAYDKIASYLKAN